jgi:hypothetical protein
MEAIQTRQIAFETETRDNFARLFNLLGPNVGAPPVILDNTMASQLAPWLSSGGLMPGSVGAFTGIVAVEGDVGPEDEFVPIIKEEPAVRVMEPVRLVAEEEVQAGVTEAEEEVHAGVTVAEEEVQAGVKEAEEEVQAGVTEAVQEEAGLAEARLAAAEVTETADEGDMAKQTEVGGSLMDSVLMRLRLDANATKEAVQEAVVRYGEENMLRSSVVFLKALCQYTQTVQYSSPKKRTVQQLMEWAQQRH